MENLLIRYVYDINMFWNSSNSLNFHDLMQNYGDISSKNF